MNVSIFVIYVGKKGTSATLGFYNGHTSFGSLFKDIQNLVQNYLLLL